MEKPRATIRELRNEFPKVRKLVEEAGEVLVTDHGTPRYRLTVYSPDRSRSSAPGKDYLERLRRHQPRPLSRAAARALRDANRDNR
jgi:antitoxin (DNA-binding transcriptional repressor) of toxin-antitoxin stability system